MRILLILLTLFSSVLALHPIGVKAYQTITINAAQVAETNSHFLYQRKIPRTGEVIANCTSSVNIVVYNSTADTTKRPKWVVFTTDTIFLYTDIAVSTVTGGALIIGYGLTTNTINSASTFTNCGITHYYGLNETVGSSTAIDYASGNDLTIGAGVTMGNGCYFYKCATMNNLTTSTLTYGSDLFGTGLKTFSAIIKIQVKNYTEIFRTGSFIIRSTAAALEIYNNSVLASFAGTPIPNNTVCHLAVIRKADGKVSAFVNGSQVGTETSTTTPVAGTLISVGLNNASYTYNGTIEEINFLSGGTAGYVQMRYNMLFNPSTFSTLGAVKSTSTTSGTSRWTAFKTNNKWDTFKRAWK